MKQDEGFGGGVGDLDDSSMAERLTQRTAFERDVKSVASTGSAHASERSARTSSLTATNQKAFTALQELEQGFSSEGEDEAENESARFRELLASVERAPGRRAPSWREFSAESLHQPPRPDSREILRADDNDFVLQKYQAKCVQLGIRPRANVGSQLTQAVAVLRHQGISSRCSVAVASALRVADTLTVLDLEGNWLGNDGTRAVAYALQRNKSVEVLNLGANGISYRGACAVADLVRVSKNLKRLSLHANRLGDTAVAAICSSLHENQVVRFLNLSSNVLGSGAGESLSVMLQRNETVEELLLSWNGLRAAGARALGEGLTHNRGLRRLELACNGFADDGAESIGQAIRENHDLQVLDLRDNRIQGEQGLPALVEGIRLNRSLRTVKLSNNPIGPELGAEIQSAARSSLSIRELELEHCYFTPTPSKQTSPTQKVEAGMRTLRAAGAGSATSDLVRAKLLSQDIAGSAWLPRSRPEP